jgi:hypothetical protein
VLSQAAVPGAPSLGERVSALEAEVAVLRQALEELAGPIDSA